MRLLLLILFALSPLLSAHAQTKQVLKNINGNTLTENLVLPAGKTITINSGATIINNGTATGFGGGGTWGSITGTLTDQADLAAALAAKQTLDSDLTAIAALSTQAYGRSVLETANAAALRSLASLGSLATLSTITSSEITDGAIGNADIAALANISISKIAGIGANRLFGTGGSFAVGQDITVSSPLSLSSGALSLATGDRGDITVSSGGVTWSIDSGAVTDAMLAGSITPSKITGTAATLGANTFTGTQAANIFTGRTAAPTIMGVSGQVGVCYFHHPDSYTGANAYWSIGGAGNLYWNGLLEGVGYRMVDLPGSGVDCFIKCESVGVAQIGLDNSAPVSQMIKGADGDGTNIAGGNFRVAAGRGTGSGVGGSLELQTAPAGSSGATAGTLTTRMTIKGTGVINVSGMPTSTSGLVSGDLWNDSGTVKVVP